MEQKQRRIEPQEGFQYQFLSSTADIVIGGGAAGAGKTYALLVDPIRHVKNNPDFGGVVFRRTYPQIKAEGGLWDTSMDLYPHAGGKPSESNLEWRFKSKAKMKFSHLEYDKNVLDWQGSQIPFIGFDELTHFSEYAFFYLLSRNRTMCKVKPYVRATCNPDPDSWVANFISLWIEQDHNDPRYGFPIPERAGKIRFFMKDSDEYVWGDTKQEVLNQVDHLIRPLQEADPTIDPKDLVKSVTFIPGTIYGNKELLRADPGYLGNLLAQDESLQAQLLHGNWKVRVDGTDLINVHKLKDTFSNSTVPTGHKYLTADIALKGSDLLVIFVWNGFRLIACKTMPKSKGPEVIDAIKEMASEYSVPQGNITYDHDGVGGFIEGYIENANPFNNNRRAAMQENYKNLKTQCYYKLGDRINRMGYYIDPAVAKMKIGTKTLEQHLMEERRAIKRDKIDEDGKLCIIPKEEMKVIIGHSPDFMDAMMMREFFEFIEPDEESAPLSRAVLGL